MMYPLVRELAVDGTAVTVTCRVLNIARQPYYRWLACPITDAEWDEAQLANTIFDAHRDDPEFGYRFPADEARSGGHAICNRSDLRSCLRTCAAPQASRRVADRSTLQSGDFPMRQRCALTHVKLPRKGIVADPTTLHNSPII